MNTLVKSIPIEAAPASLQDNRGDLDRLKQTLARKLNNKVILTPFARLTTVSQRFRQAGFKGAAIVNDLTQHWELVDFCAEPQPRLTAIALDLGTTHLEANLLDLTSGKILAAANEENSQISYGTDILSRLHFADKNNGLETLHNAVINCTNKLVAKLAKQAKIKSGQIRALTVAGNNAMIHFFLKLNPYHLCREPYIPVVNSPDPCRASELKLTIHPAAVVWVLPGISSYFGGDLVAGILASNLEQQETTSMLIDVGTNAEVVIGNREWLIACAGAAGPALEGGVSKIGMRAQQGAIEHVRIDPSTNVLTYSTIGNIAPVGLCGSGMIDLVANLYLTRIIDIRGKFRPQYTEKRLVADKGDWKYIVVHAAETTNNKMIAINQVDLDGLIRSKAAMYAILTTLINQIGLSFDALQQIYVAGAFGKHIDPRQAITIGMLPDLPINRYKAIGNSSLAGARQILLDRQVRIRCQELAKKITYIELNVNQEFMILFSGCRFIPHTDHTLFPNVPYFNE